MKQITCPHCGDTYPDFDVAHVCSKGPYAPRLKSKMNERIKALAEQANADELSYAYYRGEKRPENAVTLHSVDLEKFAELIVKECADVGSKFSMAHPEDIRYQIKRHFGVEE